MRLDAPRVLNVTEQTSKKPSWADYCRRWASRTVLFFWLDRRIRGLIHPSQVPKGRFFRHRRAKRMFSVHRQSDVQKYTSAKQAVLSRPSETFFPRGPVVPSPDYSEEPFFLTGGSRPGAVLPSLPGRNPPTWKIVSLAKGFRQFDEPPASGVACKQRLPGHCLTRDRYWHHDFGCRHEADVFAA
ncbi:hypothetical protein Q31b_12890 [Novipirellula aureliae]|uniref:Uncharacterized protein n=1 Tax=Novipirellula aureliae TaxID=2527966 RepID=A0A5C6E983_9BACT|nr:hypothetical protein Q31b_12890 [Novipirellula aureliae]